MRVDEHEGAVEADKPSDQPQRADEVDPALDDQGLPKDCDKIDSERIGAVMDDTQG